MFQQDCVSRDSVKSRNLKGIREITVSLRDFVKSQKYLGLGLGPGVLRFYEISKMSRARARPRVLGIS